MIREGWGQLLQLLAIFLASAAGDLLREGFLGGSAAGGGDGETLVTVFRREVDTSLYFSAFFGIKLSELVSVLRQTW